MMRGMLQTATTLLLLLFLAAGSLYGQVGRSESDFIHAKRLYEDGFYDLAVEALQAFIVSYPDSPNLVDAKLLVGKAYFADERFSDARMAFQKVELEYPDSPAALTSIQRQAECLLRMGERDKAARTYFRIPVYYPSSAEAPQALLQAATILVEMDRLDDAEEPVQQILNQYPDFPRYQEAQLLWARINAQRGQYDLAQRDAQRVALKTQDPGLAAEALYFAGGWLEELGRMDEAETVWRKIVESYPDTDPQPIAMERLGNRLLRQGRIEDALALYSEVLEEDVGATVKIASVEGIADARFMQGDWAKGVEIYRTLLDTASLGERTRSVRFRLALSLEYGGEREQAVEIYRELARDKEGRFSAAAAWRYGVLAERQGDIEAGIEAFKLAREGVEDAYMTSEIIYRLAELQLKEDPEDVLETLEKFEERFPQSNRVDEAGFLRLRALEALDRIDEAIEGYKTFQSHWPFSPLVEDARERLHNLVSFQVGEEDPSMKLAGLLAESAAGLDQAELAVRLADIYLRDFKDFDKAIQQYQSVISSQKQSDDRKQRAAVGLSEAYWLKWQKSAMALPAYLDSVQLSKRSESAAHLAKTLRDLSELLPDSAKASVEYRIHSIELSAMEEERRIQSARVRWPAFVNKYPLSVKAPEAIYKAGWAFSQPIEADTADTTGETILTAIEYLELVRDEHRGYRNRQEALLLLGDLYRLVGRVEDAVNAYSMVMGAGESPEAIKARVRLIHDDSLPLPDRLQMVEDIRSKAPYHPDLESIRLTAVDLMLEAGWYEQAEGELRAIMDSHEPGDPGLVMLGDQKRKLSYLLAVTLEGQGRRTEAVSEYLRYLAYFPNGQDASRARFRLAELYQGLGEAVEALKYYRKTTEDRRAGGHLQRTSFRRITRIELALGEYADAREAAMEVVNRSTDQDTVFEYRQLATITLYRRGLLELAKNEALQVRRDFKKRDDVDFATARFYLEKGRWYSNQKQFPAAEDNYKIVLKKYESTPWAAEAKYLLGRDMLAQNREEEGLPLLQEMTEQYPDHPIVGSVWMTMGNYLVRNGRLVEGASAYERITNNRRFEHLWPAVYQNQMKVYKQAGFYAGALKAVQGYLDLYPNAEDRIEKQMEIGRLYMLMEQYDLAISHFRDIQPFTTIEQEAESQYYIGEALEKQSRYAEATIEYLKVDYLGKKTKMQWAVTALYSAGRCYEKMGRSRKARDMYAEIVTRMGLGDPLGRTAQEQIDRLRQGE
ncbi:tetratricopeptide repeat protein [bacterium]|nr:tetratricopeptide repeat protein [bacterium]